MRAQSFPQNMSSDFHSRRAFHIPKMESLLTPTAKQYCCDFINSLGYNCSTLSDDRFAEIFSEIARLEEYKCFYKHNHHNWEFFFSSLQNQMQFMEPSVNIKLQSWLQKGELSKLSIEPPLWPDNKKFALCLTHDVDILSGLLLKNRLRSLPYYRVAPSYKRIVVALSTAREAARWLRFWAPPPDPPLEIWLEAEAKHGFYSSFFFFGVPSPYAHWEDSFYRYSDKISFEGRKRTIAEIIREVARRGWDVGLHGASRSSFDPHILAVERNLLSDVAQQDIITTRQHHLFFDVRYTPVFQQQAGFQADSTLGSNQAIGFRGGTCFPFYFYDVYNDQPFDLLEVPLIIQDIVLFRIQQLDADLATMRCIEMMQKIANLGGVCTLLWHNNVQPESQEFKTYCNVLEEASRMGAWGCSVQQLNDWWRNRITRLKNCANSNCMIS